jgi:hypothetical protein
MWPKIGVKKVIGKSNCSHRKGLVALLSQVENDLGAHAGGGPTEGVGNQGIADVAIKIKLNLKLLVYLITQVRPDLNVDVSIGNGGHVVNFPLNRLVVGYTEVKPEVDIILYGDHPAMITERHPHVILDKTNFQ